jgi:hypothetical protein
MKEVRVLNVLAKIRFDDDCTYVVSLEPNEDVAIRVKFHDHWHDIVGTYRLRVLEGAK